MSINKTKIKDHWELLAEKNQSYKSSWEDYFMIQKEIEQICRHITGNENICEVGCNNGYCDFELLKKFPNIKLTGIDYSTKAIEQANADNSAYQDRAKFLVGDILDTTSYPQETFDIVLVKRTIINLDTEEQQLCAIDNLLKLVKNTGKILIMEAVEENWKRLNEVRKEIGLDELKQPWHNKYLSNNVVNKIYEYTVVEDSHYASSYYLLSRAFIPLVRKLVNAGKSNDEVNKVDYLNELNRLAYTLPNFGDYGIQRLFVISPKNK